MGTAIQLLPSLLNIVDMSFHREVRRTCVCSNTSCDTGNISCDASCDTGAETATLHVLGMLKACLANLPTQVPAVHTHSLILLPLPHSAVFEVIV